MQLPDLGSFVVQLSYLKLGIAAAPRRDKAGANARIVAEIEILRLARGAAPGA
jgi:hypothetical protein